MKICIATDAWHPQINGVVTTLNHTVRTLQALGHRVEVINPGQFRSFPCPTYPEISLAPATPAMLCRRLDDIAVAHSIADAAARNAGFAIDQREHDVGVADIDCEQHQAPSPLAGGSPHTSPAWIT